MKSYKQGEVSGLTFKFGWDFPRIFVVMTKNELVYWFEMSGENGAEKEEEDLLNQLLSTFKFL